MSAAKCQWCGAPSTPERGTRIESIRRHEPGCQLRPLPSQAAILDALVHVEPATIEEVRIAVGAAWEQRGTVRNRVWALVDQGLVIADEGCPERFAINAVRPLDMSSDQVVTS